MLTRLRNSPLLPAALALLLRVPFFSWPLISDEGSYAYDVYWWVRGFPLYVNLLGVERPQGLFVSYLVPVVLLGGATWAIRLWGALWIAATNLAVAACARRLLGERYAFPAALLYALYSSMPAIEGFTANAETFLVLPLTLSALALLDGRWFWAGLTAGLAISCKASGGSALFLAAAWLLYTRSGWRSALRLAAGAGIVLAALVAHGVWSAGWPNYLYNMLGVRSGGLFQPYGSPLIAALYGWSSTAVAWLPLVAVLPSLSVLPRRRALFLWLWLGCCLLGMSVSGHWYWHYWIQLMPALCLAGSLGLLMLWSKGRAISRQLAAAVLVIPVVALARFAVLPPLEGDWALYHRPGYQIATAAADYIRAHTEEHGTIYVAFSEADIYHLARRRAAVPYLFYAYVVSLPGAYDEIVASIASRTPAYVLALDRPITTIDPDGRFDAALQANYAPERTFGPAVLYRRRPVP